MNQKWLVVFGILLILLSWTLAFAGPKDNYGHGDDDIPELMRPRRPATPDKLMDSLGLDYFWDAVLRLNEKEPELSNQQRAQQVGVPAAQRYSAGQR